MVHRMNAVNAAGVRGPHHVELSPRAARPARSLGGGALLEVLRSPKSLIDVFCELEVSSELDHWP